MVYVGECVGNVLVGRLRKRLIEFMNGCLKKKFECWDRRMVYY